MFIHLRRGPPQLAALSWPHFPHGENVGGIGVCRRGFRYGPHPFRAAPRQEKREVSGLSILNNLINGISLGSVYAIIALGYTMVYGIAKMLNFAHGDIIMVGA